MALWASCISTTSLTCRLQLIRSVSRASTFSALKFIEIVILGVYSPSLLASVCFGTFVISLFNFLVHLSRRLKCTIVITRCPSSVRPSLTFHIFDFSSETTEQNSMKLDSKQDLNTLYQVCVFSGRSEKQDGGPGL